MGKHRNDAYNAQQKQRETIRTQAAADYEKNKTPSPLEGELNGVSQDFSNNYKQATNTNMAQYGDLMKGYGDFAKNAKFSYNPVSAGERPKELNESYATLREALPGYREFANTGGYSPTDVQELRARGTSPIRAAYGNTMMELNRARSLGGNGGAPNYIAAASRAQRELPGQLADATTNVNAGLADSIRQGKLAGLSGMTNIGGTMGGLSSDEAGRTLTADLANQSADLRTQGMTSDAKLAGMSGASSLYGTTPGLSRMFGDQALTAYGQRAGMEQSRNQFGLGLMDAQMRSFNPQNDVKQKPWWQTALGYGMNIGGNILGAYAGAPGGRI